MCPDGTHHYHRKTAADGSGKADAVETIRWQNWVKSSEGWIIEIDYVARELVWYRMSHRKSVVPWRRSHYTLMRSQWLASPDETAQMMEIDGFSLVKEMRNPGGVTTA